MIRLSVLLSIHGVSICAALILMTVLFVVINDRAFEDNTEELIQINMRRTSTLIKMSIGSYEHTVKNIATTIARFNISARFFNLAAFLENNTLSINGSTDQNEDAPDSENDALSVREEQRDFNNKFAFTSLVDLWNALTVADLGYPYLIGTFEMWLSKKSSRDIINSTTPGRDDDIEESEILYSASGCLRNTSYCYLYDADMNVTLQVPSEVLKGEFDVGTYKVQMGQPSSYEREKEFINYNIIRNHIDFHGNTIGIWSPMYVDLAKTGDGADRSSRTCDGKPIIKSLTYYFCADTTDSIQVVNNIVKETEGINGLRQRRVEKAMGTHSIIEEDYATNVGSRGQPTFAEGDNADRIKNARILSEYICNHIVGVTVEASHLGEVKELALTENSILYALALHMVDRANGACAAPDRVLEAFYGYLDTCTVNASDNLYSSVEPSSKESSPYRNYKYEEVNRNVNVSSCKNSMNFRDSDVITVQGLATATRLELVIVDISPRKSFFSVIDKAKSVSIAVSVSIIVLTVVISGIVYYFTAFPIRWITAGLRNAALLGPDDEELRKNKRYTIISEVTHLYDTYLELRQALKELKSFVPQGLFLSPPNVDATSRSNTFAALMGYDTNKDESTTSSSAEDSGNEDVVDEDTYSYQLMSNSLPEERERRNKEREEDDEMVVFGNSTSAHNARRSLKSHFNSSLKATDATVHADPMKYNQAATDRQQQEEVSVVVHIESTEKAGKCYGEVIDDDSSLFSVKQLPMPIYSSTDNSGDAPKIHTILKSSKVDRAGQSRVAFELDEDEVNNNQTLYNEGYSPQFPEYTSPTKKKKEAPQKNSDGIVHLVSIPMESSFPPDDKSKPNKDKKDESTPYEKKIRFSANENGKQNDTIIDDSSKIKIKEKGSPNRKSENSADASNFKYSDALNGKASMAQRRISLYGNDAGNNNNTITNNSTFNNVNMLTLNTSPESRMGLNKFRNVTCSFLLLTFTFPYLDTESLEVEVSALMRVVVKAVLRWGGVLEVFRPDFIGVSFGAHSSLPQHIQVSTACALTILRKLSPSQRSYTRAASDSGQYFVGNCGAHSRVSRIVFGNHFDFLFDLNKHEFSAGRLLVTDRVAAALPPDLSVPVDYIIPKRNGRVFGIQIYQVVDPLWRRNAARMQGINQFREMYALAMQGDFRGALQQLQSGNFYDTAIAEHFNTAIKYLLAMRPPRPNYCRFQLPCFEPLGNEVKRVAPKYKYDKLSVQKINAKSAPRNEMDALNNVSGGNGNEDSAYNVSINFGFGFGEESNSSNTNLINFDNVDGSNSKNNGLYNSSQNGGLNNNNNDRSNTNHEASRAAFFYSTATSGGNETSKNQENIIGTPVTLDAEGQVKSVLRNSAPSENNLAGDRTLVYDGGNKANSSSPDGGKSALNGSVPNELFDELPKIITDSAGEQWTRMPQPVGTGSFAEVYVAVNTAGVQCAIKCIRLNQNHVQLDDVVQEVNTACKLFHDSIVNYTGWAHRGPYLILFMEYMPGGTIAGILRAFPTGMCVPVVRRYASDMLRGLAYLHMHNIVHADFKPQNVLLSVDGYCRISDFGSSVTKANALSASGDVFSLRGTPLYMAPEVAAGDPPTSASDMWSLGITMFEMLTGHRPWVMRQKKSTNRMSPSPEPEREHEVESSGASKSKNTSGTDSKEDEERLWVPVQGLSDVRFLQLYAQKNIKVRLNEAEVPTPEAFQLLNLCLQEDPQNRPCALDLINHVFFLSV